MRGQGNHRAFATLIVCIVGVACGGSKQPGNSSQAGAPSEAGAGTRATAGSGGMTAAGSGGMTAGSGGMTAAGSGGTTPGSSCSSTPPVSVPAQWVRPSDCKGVGNLCSEGCNGSACQLLGEVCIPFAGIGASASSCLPYCLASACMSFDEASCFCTGSAAAQFPACACGPGAIAGRCAAEGRSCASTPCCDCMGLKCVTDSVSGTVCRQPCSKNADCATGCCNTATGTCRDSLYCSCVSVGAACESQGAQCCPGTTCLTFSGDLEKGPFSCYQDCSNQSDCASGCCSQTIPGLNHGACGPC